MDYVNIDDFISKTTHLPCNTLLCGFKIGDCVKISTVCYHGKRSFTLSILGCITDITFNTFGTLNISVKDCSSNITFVFHDFSDFKRVNCNGC